MSFHRLSCRQECGECEQGADFVLDEDGPGYDAHYGMLMRCRGLFVYGDEMSHGPRPPNEQWIRTQLGLSDSPFNF